MSVLSVEECELLSDGKYRNYITNVEKALRSFEYTSEWADLISALGKINKVLLNHIKYPVIPKRVTIGKRLAQCLHPALPSGVHLKALETYDIIFKCIGTQRLAADLFIYTAGLFPLMGHAAMSVRPVLLGIYEKHFIHLAKQIKPGLGGLLLGLLPGLEEGSEVYDRTNSLLEVFSDSVDQVYFYTCLWQSILTCPSVRLPAVTYLLAHFNKKKSMDDQIYIMGQNIELLVTTVCTSVQDTSVLVQRCVLDFILYAFPLHAGHLIRDDLGQIIHAAVTVVLRRDMSLNRRLYAWLLGTDTNGVPLPGVSGDVSAKRQRADSTSTISEADTSYFQNYSKEYVVSAVKYYLMDSYSLSGDSTSEASASRRAQSLKPFRMLISLLDKPEIGPIIIEEVLLEVFRCLYRECVCYEYKQNHDDLPMTKSAVLMSLSRMSSPEDRDKRGMKNMTKIKTDKSSNEMIKSANLLFASLEPYFAWDYIAKTFELACQDKHDSNLEQANIGIVELCDLVDFLLDAVSLETYIETTTEHLPDLLHHIIRSITNHCSVVSDEEVTCSLNLCAKILEKVQPSMTILGNEAHDETVSISEKAERKFSASSEADLLVDSENLEINEKISEKKDENEKDVISEAVFHGDNVIGTDKVSKVDDKASPTDTEIDTSSVPAVTPDSAISELTKLDLPDDITPSPLSEMNNEFQMYNSVEIQKSPRVSYKISGPLTLMQASVNSFQNFFHIYVTERVLRNESVARQCIESMTLPTEQIRSWEHDSVIDSDSTCSQEEIIQSDCAVHNRTLFGDVADKAISAECCEAFICACKLLVDFSSFPMYCTDYQRVIDRTRTKDEEVSLPLWLEDLITSSCFNVNFPIQSVAIATILDLIILTQSVQSESESKTSQDSRRQSCNEGTVSVVLLPALLPRHLKFLNENTLFYQTIAQELWSRLTENTPEFHHRSVELFHLLHQVTPNPWICEDVIGRQLVTDQQGTQVEAFKKFCVLWHLTRDKKTEPTPGKTFRTFDRSMFVCLDHLREDTSPSQTIASTWLTHAVQRGDLGRILEPLLLMLLHPDTARVSIQHVNIHKPQNVRLSESGDDADSAEANIYAISSEGGKVIYHVSGHGRQISKKNVEHLRSFAVSVTKDGDSASSVTTAPTRAQMELSFERISAEDVKLRVNPFSSQNSLDTLMFDGVSLPKSKSTPSSLQLPDFSNAKRLTKETCRREGIYFDGHDEETLEKSEQETDDNVCEKIIDESASEISKKIIEGLISNVVNDFDENSCESIDTRTNSEDMNQDPELTSNEQRLTPIGHDRKSLSKSPSDSLLASRKRAALRTLSTSSRDNSMLNDEDLLNGIDRRNVTIDSPIEGDNDTELKFPVGGLTPTSPGVHTLHMHILLYTQRYDYRRTLYALLTFKSLLIKCPRLIVISMATTSITATQTPNIAKLQTLLARHRKSVFGKNYFGDVYPETVTSYRSNMYLEIIVSLCLYYIRSYYPNLMMSKLSGDELNGNKEVHILGTDVLTLLMTELGRITKDSGKNFATYVGDLLKRSKLQKAILHCILASIYNARTARSNSSTSSDVSTTSSVTEAIVDFNEHDLEPVAIETFQKKLLDLLLVIVKLEDHILRASGEADAFMSSSGSVSASSASAIWDRAHVNFMPSLTQVQYNPALPVVQQPMFLSCVLSALKQQHQSHMHRHWIGLVTASLPYLGSGLAQVAIAITAQLCRNLELLSHIYERGQLGSERRSTSHSKHSSIVSPDLIVTMIEGLITVCHYCLLDNSPAQVSIGQHGQPNSGSGADSGTSSNTNFFSLLHVFNTSNTRESSPLHDSSSTNSPVMEARRGLLNILPRIISCLATLWKSVRVSEGMGAATGQPQCVWIMGYPKVIGQHVLEFLSPLSVPHGLNLLAAIAIDWYERRKKNMPHRKKPVIPVPSSDQLLLVDLVGEIKVLPTDKLVQTIKQVLKQPAQTADMLRTKGSNLEVSMLQFFFAYIQDTPPMQLLDSWPSLLSLLKETLQINLSPPSIFLLLEILNEFVQKCPTMDDRKAQKELQDIAQKLLEAVGMIAGSCLEQTTWLRKNFAVKPGPQTDLHDLDDLDGVDENEKVPQPVERKVVVPQNAANADAKYNVQALTLLAERTSCLLDVIYGSDEKEKITPFLTSLMYNVFPYLRSHSSHNLPSFRACSSILASLSGYQYSRKAWRKEALELLLDASFFQMDVKCVVYWRTVVDNLMTHDKTTFKDLMTRVAITQSGSLNLFTNKEQELEQRSMLLKRLAFTLFCSEPDQYQKNMPDIQERLSESLRLPQMPSIIAQVFLCFRVLVLRMSPHHLTSLWPTIITEMVHIFMQIEQELSTETDEFKTQLQRIAALDASWANLGNGLNAHNNPAWLLLYLGACKLLDQMLAMPADMIPQFQLYRWAFIGSAVDESEDDDEKGMKSSSQNEDARKRRKRLAKPQFVPHVVRITKLMNSKIRRVPAVWTVTPGRPLLNIPVITSLAELHPFFNALCLADNIEPRFISKHTSMLETRVPKIPKASSAPEIDQLSSMTNINNTFHGPSQEKTTLQCIEGILEQDFVEPLNTG